MPSPQSSGRHSRCVAASMSWSTTPPTHCSGRSRKRATIRFAAYSTWTFTGRAGSGRILRRGGLALGIVRLHDADEHARRVPGDEARYAASPESTGQHPLRRFGRRERRSAVPAKRSFTPAAVHRHVEDAGCRPRPARIALPETCPSFAERPGTIPRTRRPKPKQSRRTRVEQARETWHHVSRSADRPDASFAARRKRGSIARIGVGSSTVPDIRPSDAHRHAHPAPMPPGQVSSGSAPAPLSRRSYYLVAWGIKNRGRFRSRRSDHLLSDRIRTSGFQTPDGRRCASARDQDEG